VAEPRPERVPDSPIRLPGKLEHWCIDRLKPYERNPRTHSPEQITKIAASLIEFGWTNPILVDGDSGIIAGHGRLLAARELGMTTVPVIVLPHLTEAQRRAYVIADNQLALEAGWDEDLLAEELKALEDLDFDLELTGFDLDELHGYLEDEFAEEVAAPEPPEDPVSRPGDLWLLGDHRLLCGDSSDPATVDRLLAGEPVHLANTDPPYNVKVEPRSNNAIAAGLSSFAGLRHHQRFDLERHNAEAVGKGRMRPKDRPLANDFVSDEAFDEMLAAWFGNIARVLLPGRSFYIWGGYANVANYPFVLKAAGLYFGASYPASISGELTVSWSHRNRLGTWSYADSGATPSAEPGTEYDVLVYGELGTLVHTEAGLTGTSWTYPVSRTPQRGAPAPPLFRPGPSQLCPGATLSPDMHPNSRAALASPSDCARSTVSRHKPGTS
jgi:hypothetical protein